MTQLEGKSSMSENLDFRTSPDCGVIGEFAEIFKDIHKWVSGETEKDDGVERPNSFLKLCEQLVKHVRRKLDEISLVDELSSEEGVE